jgi:hypothetical protein
MPASNIDRAIKRGTGEIEGVHIDEAHYEGYGPGGVALLVEVATDNRNRTAGDVRHTPPSTVASSARPAAWRISSGLRRDRVERTAASEDIDGDRARPEPPTWRRAPRATTVTPQEAGRVKESQARVSR